MLYPLLALISGILAGEYISVPCAILLYGILGILLALFLAVRNQWRMCSFALILTLMFTAGILNVEKTQYLAHDTHHIVYQADQGRITVEGIVLASEPAPPSNDALVVQCRQMIRNNSKQPLTGNIRLIVPSSLRIQYGDLIRFHSRIRKIQSFHNPGSFDYERYMNRQGIYASGFVANPSGIVLIRHNTASGIKLTLENFRHDLKDLIYANTPSPNREILEAMIIGNQKAIPQNVRDNFSKTGTSHILSISGLHVGMVAVACFSTILLLLKFSEFLMLRWNIIKIATAAAFLPVIIYSLVAGMGTTVLRSTLMTLAFLTALLIGKPKDLYNILFGAALIILIIAPESLFDISFQLSFSAVFAILYMVPKFSDRTLPIPLATPAILQTGVRRIYIFVLVSAAATLGTLPILVYYFNQVSAVTLIANLIAVPLLGILALIPAMAFILAAPFSSALAGLLIKIASFFTSLTVSFINLLASMSWSSFSFIKPTLVEISLFYCFLLLLIQLFSQVNQQNVREFSARHRFYMKTALFIVAALMLTDAVCIFIKTRFSKDMQITAIDVGQGSATLARLPRGITMLIDGGGFQESTFDVGRMVIAPFLFAERISKIDIVVLTHPHPDHLLGLIYIVNHFHVGEVWCSGRKTDDDFYHLWENTLYENKVRLKYLSAQSPPEQISGVGIQCLWPLHPPVTDGQELSHEETNDTSLVLKMNYGSRNFLITGDISSRVESILIRSGQDLKSDLLFVPHHGSVHSSSVDFIHAVSPQYAIFSSGKNNVFRHPHPAALHRYQANGVTLLRTDQQGAISIHSDGHTLDITPWLK